MKADKRYSKEEKKMRDIENLFQEKLKEYPYLAEIIETNPGQKGIIKCYFDLDLSKNNKRGADGRKT